MEFGGLHLGSSVALHVYLTCSKCFHVECLEPAGSITVSMGIDFCDSAQMASFKLW